jgi:REP element-mobilizing transposase RayT
MFGLIARAVVAEIARASEKGSRVLHFSVQSDHVHLLCEADDGVSPVDARESPCGILPKAPRA